MISLRLEFVPALWMAFCLACGTAAAVDTGRGTMPKDSPATADARALYSRSLALARSHGDPDLSELRRNLGHRPYLDALDSATAYRGPAERLRVAGVLQALAANESPAARRALMSLTGDQVFTEHRSRTVLLIQALAVVRPPTAEVIQFWERHCQPDDGYSNYTIRAVIANGTPEALTVFEKNLQDPRHQDDRDSWLLFDVLTHRNDLHLLQSIERLLTSPLEPRLRLLLVDVVFDYRPDDWYGPHIIPAPPPRAKASREALRQLRRVGELALSLTDTTKTQRAQITKVLEETRPQVDSR